MTECRDVDSCRAAERRGFGGRAGCVRRALPRAISAGSTVLRRTGCSSEECQDLAQDTFLRAYKSFQDFRGDAKSSTWLLTIATNVWRNRIRDAAAAKRAGDQVPLPEDGQADPASGEAPQDRAITDERRRLLKTAIAKLPRKMRRCVWLRVYQDRSYREIADILGVTVQTAKSQVSLARSRLRSSLAEHYPDLAADPDDRGG